MADNVVLNSGAGGATLAADDIGGIHHQLVKVEFGAADAATQVSSANPLPVVQTGALPAGANNIGDVDVLSLPALPAGANNIGDVDVLSVIPGTGATNSGKAVDSPAGATDTGSAALAVRDDGLSALTPVEGDYVNLRTDANGALWTHDDVLEAALAGNELQVDIVAAIPAGNNNIGDVDVASIAAGTNLIGDVGIQPRTSGGLSIFHLVSAASANATNIKASAGQVYSIVVGNINAAIRYLKFHNTAGTPTAGSGVVMSIPVPGNTAGAGIAISFPQGIAFGTGIGITLVTGITDADTTAVAANEIVVTVLYK